MLRRDLSRALAALSEYLVAIGHAPDGARAPDAGWPDLAGPQARFLRTAADLGRIGNVLRLIPRRWRAGHDYLPAVTAIRRIAAVLPALTDSLTSSQPGALRLDLTPYAGLSKDIAGLRRRLGERSEPDPVAWTRLADAIVRSRRCTPRRAAGTGVPRQRHHAERLSVPTAGILRQPSPGRYPKPKHGARLCAGRMPLAGDLG